jgi:hypothetical protein
MAGSRWGWGGGGERRGSGRGCLSLSHKSESAESAYKNILNIKSYENSKKNTCACIISRWRFTFVLAPRRSLTVCTCDFQIQH